MIEPCYPTHGCSPERLFFVLRFCFDACLPCLLKPPLAGPPDGGSPTVVLVVGGNVADPSVQAHPVVFGAGPVQLGFEHDRVVDVLEVRPVALEMAERCELGRWAYAAVRGTARWP